MGMFMGCENGKKWVWGRYCQNGCGQRYGYKYRSYPTHTLPHTRFINARLVSTPYKTHIHLFKILICYLYLDILLVTLSCIVFNTSTRHFVRNCNCQALIYYFDWQTFSCIRHDMIFYQKFVVNVTIVIYVKSGWVRNRFNSFSSICTRINPHTRYT